MELAAAEQAVNRLWGAAAPLGRPWADWLGALPATVREAAGRSRLPALALVTALRDHAGASGAADSAAAVSAWLAGALAARLGADHPDALAERAASGAWALRAGQEAVAAERLEGAWRGLRRAGVADGRLAAVGETWGGLLAQRGALEQAEDVLTVALGARAGDPRLGAALGQVRLQRGDLRGAVPLLRDAWMDDAGGLSGWRLGAGRGLGAALLRLGQPGAAVPVLRVLASVEPDPEARIEVALALAGALEETGAADEALRLASDAVEGTRALDPDHPDLAGRLAKLARMVFQRGRAEDAEGLLREALDRDARSHGDGSAEVGRRTLDLGRLLLATGRAEEAMGWLEPALSSLRRALGPADPLVAQAAEALAGALLDAAGAARARGEREMGAWLAGQVGALEPLLGPRHAAVRRAAGFRP